MSAKEILKASEDFFSIHKSPTCSNLLKTCSSPTEIVKDSQSTHPLVSPKTLQLIKDYLEIQKSTLSPADFIKRVLLKRPLMFCGSNDSTITRDYQRASHLDWAHIGTSISSLSIQDYLSYDEMCISALIGVSSFTRFINSGGRFNRGQIGLKGNFIERGVVIGLVGARFERSERMESLFCIVGGGGILSPQLEEIWKRFYGVDKFPTIQDAIDDPKGFQKLVIHGKVCYLNKILYKLRMKTTAELFFKESVDRGRETGKPIFANTVGLGLGVWKVHDCQKLLFAEAFIEVANELGLSEGVVLNFSYISLTTKDQETLALSTKLKILFLDRDLASPLPVEYSDHLLVTNYAWDGNSFPGNEIFSGSLDGSGDPAANCCCTIFELHNPYINPFCDRIGHDFGA